MTFQMIYTNEMEYQERTPLLCQNLRPIVKQTINPGPAVAAIAETFI